MSRRELSATTAIVTGAGQGFGRAIATALSHAGAHVVGVGRDGARLDEVHALLGEAFTPVVSIRFTAQLPRLTPATQLGAAAVAAYAARQGGHRC